MSNDGPETGFTGFLRAWPALVEEASETGTAVLVEGERDRAALRKLGMRGRITLVHQGRSLSELTGALAHDTRRVILLTDWDGRGGTLARRVRDLLAPGPPEVDLEWRRRLARILRAELTHVEGLYAWARRNAESAGAPLDHFLGPDGPGGLGPTG